MTATLSANDERIPLLQSKTIRTASPLCINRLAYSKTTFTPPIITRGISGSTNVILFYITITMFFLEEGMQSVACTLIIQCLSTLQIACCTIYPLSVFGITVYTLSFISILLPTFLLYGQNFFISFNSLFRSLHPVEMFYNLFL